MKIQSFLEKDSETFTHVLADEINKVCAIIDPVLNFDYASGTTTTTSTDEVLSYIKQHDWTLKYIIETHAHADHLSSASYIKQQCIKQGYTDETAPKIVIGKHISLVQEVFKEVYNLDISFKTDASQFDVLTEEGTELLLGDLVITALHVPGHTPADMAYKVVSQADDNSKNNADNTIAVFVGDTIFAPDVGTARCDFPKGSAHALYQSIQRLLAMPADTKLYLCHDYPPKDGQRTYQAVTTVAEQKRDNKHIKDGVSEDEFVAMREARDATLSMPRLILPSVQVNIQAGKFPEPENNGVRYMKVPIDYF